MSYDPEILVMVSSEKKKEKKDIEKTLAKCLPKNGERKRGNGQQSKGANDHLTV